MGNGSTNSHGLTRGDKAHQKKMDRLTAFKAGSMHALDSFTIIHKQTVDASSKHTEIIAKSQEAERTAFCEIIKTCEDETRRKEAFDRLAELDRIKKEEIQNYNNFIQNEGDKAKKNINGGFLWLAFACGLISSKQVRQMTGRALTTISRNLPQIRK